MDIALLYCGAAKGGAGLCAALRCGLAKLDVAAALRRTTAVQSHAAAAAAALHRSRAAELPSRAAVDPALHNTKSCFGASKASNDTR